MEITHTVTVERNNSFLTGRNLKQNQAQSKWLSAKANWEFKKTETDTQKEHKSTDPKYFSMVKKYNSPAWKKMCWLVS